MEFLSIILRLIAAWGRVGFVLQGERGDRGAPGGREGMTMGNSPDRIILNAPDTVHILRKLYK